MTDDLDREICEMLREDAGRCATCGASLRIVQIEVTGEGGARLYDEDFETVECPNGCEQNG